METTKKRLQKLKKGDVSDIGECGGEMEMPKDENTLEKEGGNAHRGQGNAKKTNKRESRGNLDGKDVEKEAEVEGEDVDRSINVAEEEELDGGIVDKAEKKKKKKDKDNKKKSDFGYQFLEQGLQNEKIAGTGVLDGCLPENVGKKKNERFSDHVEEFPLSDHEEKLVQGKDHEEKLVHGKRFSREEDEIVRKAVYDYIEAHNLGDEGLNMVLNCRSHREVRNCWKEIAMAIPYRPKDAIYHRAQNLFTRSETRKWTEEELEMVKEHQKKHGNNWKSLAEELHKHTVHVKDAWRRIKISNRKKGKWSQAEYQGLFDLVNHDLKSRLKEEKKSKHGMLRGNISFEAISDTLSTRPNALCCLKWYQQLRSSMVDEGQWGDSDDYRLIIALYELDASCIEDVDWDSLLEHRSGDICRKRWNQMALHIGYHGTRSFSEQVDVLGKRYCPDLLEVREAWDNKPVVD